MKINFIIFIITALEWEPIEPDGSMYGMFYHKANSDKDAVVAGLKYGVGVGNFDTESND